MTSSAISPCAPNVPVVKPVEPRPFDKRKCIDIIDRSCGVSSFGNKVFYLVSVWFDYIQQAAVPSREECCFWFWAYTSTDRGNEPEKHSEFLRMLEVCTFDPLPHDSHLYARLKMYLASGGQPDRGDRFFELTYLWRLCTSAKGAVSGMFSALQEQWWADVVQSLGPVFSDGQCSEEENTLAEWANGFFPDITGQSNPRLAAMAALAVRPGPYQWREKLAKHVFDKPSCIPEHLVAPLLFQSQDDDLLGRFLVKSPAFLSSVNVARALLRSKSVRPTEVVNALLSAGPKACAAYGEKVSDLLNELLQTNEPELVPIMLQLATVPPSHKQIALSETARQFLLNQPALATPLLVQESLKDTKKKAYAISVLRAFWSSNNRAVVEAEIAKLSKVRAQRLRAILDSVAPAEPEVGRPVGESQATTESQPDLSPSSDRTGNHSELDTLSQWPDWVESCPSQFSPALLSQIPPLFDSQGHRVPLRVVSALLTLFCAAPRQKYRGYLGRVPPTWALAGKPVTLEQAEQYFLALAENISPKSGRQLANYLLDHFLHSTTPMKATWCLLPLTYWPNSLCLETIRRASLDSSLSETLLTLLLEALAVTLSDDSVWLLKELSLTGATKCKQICQKMLAFRVPETPSLFCEKYAPRFSCDNKGVWSLSAGDTDYLAHLDGPGHLVLHDGAGHPVHELRGDTRTQDSDLFQLAREELKALRQLLSLYYPSLAKELTLCWLGFYRWPALYWQQRYLEHPLLAVMARSLLWVQMNPTKPVVFRLTSDGGFVNSHDEPVSIDAVNPIELLHPAILSDDEIKRWQDHLFDYKVLPAFSQLNRPIIRKTTPLLPDDCNPVVWEQLTQLANKGWAHSTSVNNQWVRTFVTRGIEAVLWISKRANEYRYFTPQSVVFRTIKGAQCTSQTIDDHSVSAELWSEVGLDLEPISKAAKTALQRGFCTMTTTVSHVDSLPHYASASQLPVVVDDLGQLIDPNVVEDWVKRVFSLKIGDDSVEDSLTSLRDNIRSWSVNSRSGLVVELLQRFFSNGASAKDYGLLSLLAVECDLVIRTSVQPLLLREKNSHIEAEKVAIEWLTYSPQRDGVWLLYELSKRSVAITRPRANDCLKHMATKAGITVDELLSQNVPTCGLNPDGEIPFVFSSGRWLGRHLAIGEITLFDPKGKKVKSLPGPKSTEVIDRVLAAKKTIESIKYSFEQIIPDRKAYLNKHLVAQTLYREATWRELFVGHPVLWPMAKSLLWAAIDRDGRYSTIFSINENRISVDSANQPVSLSEGQNIVLVHPVLMEENALNQWSLWLRDAKVEQAIKQIERPIFHEPPTFWQAGKPAPTGKFGSMYRTLMSKGWFFMQGNKNCYRKHFAGHQIDAEVPYEKFETEPYQYSERVFAPVFYRGVEELGPETLAALQIQKGVEPLVETAVSTVIKSEVYADFDEIIKLAGFECP